MGHLAYYNENDPVAAQWLRNLIHAGHIAPGDVDERDIRDVRPADLVRYTQCHFFAGVGIWSYALRATGWPDSRPVWTGSCPCQPLSGAGRGKGADDERHLWPAFDWLIQQRRPPEILGEQVASKLGLTWLDLVSSDLENKGYAIGSSDLCAAGCGPKASESWFLVAARFSIQRCADLCSNPILSGQLRDFADDLMSAVDGGYHIRQRLYWHAKRMGDPDSTRTAPGIPEQAEREKGIAKVNDNGSDRLFRPNKGRPGFVGLANTTNLRRDRRGASEAGNEPGSIERPERFCNADKDRRPCPTNGFWRDADWLFCRDGKWRPVRSGSFPLARKSTARVGRLRAYGNGLDAETAKTFIKAAMHTNGELVT